MSNTHLVDSSFRSKHVSILEILDFLSKNNYSAFRWNGKEECLVTPSGEEMGHLEFYRASLTRSFLDDVHNDLYGYPPFEIRLSP